MRWILQRLCGALLFAWLLGIPHLAAQDLDYLSDPDAGIALTHSQAWGDFGRDTAAARPGGVGSPMRIGDRTFARGLGHHANGEIVVDLRGQYSSFRCLVGVQWQAGNRGSVVFRVLVDGDLKFETGPMSDSDPPRPVEVPVGGARELRLVASDAGDGIGCDMANWAEAALIRDPRAPFFGGSRFAFGNEPAPPASTVAGGFALIAAASGPQVALLESARMMTVSVDRGEEVRMTMPVRSPSGPLRVLADVRVVRGTSAEVELSLGTSRVQRTVKEGDAIELATDSLELDGAAEIAIVTRGIDAETGVRWSGLRYVLGDEAIRIPLSFPQTAETIPPPELPDPRPSIEQELIEWDWRMQDGISTARQRRSWAEATETTLERGDRLIENLSLAGVSLGESRTRWETTGRVPRPVGQRRRSRIRLGGLVAQRPSAAAADRARNESAGASRAVAVRQKRPQRVQPPTDPVFRPLCAAGGRCVRARRTGPKYAEPADRLAAAGQRHASRRVLGTAAACCSLFARRTRRRSTGAPTRPSSTICSRWPPTVPGCVS
jgi:hypothetical protein